MRQLSFDDRLVPDEAGTASRRAKRRSPKPRRPRKPRAGQRPSRLSAVLALARQGVALVCGMRRRTLLVAAGGAVASAFGIYLAAGGAGRLGDSIGSGIAGLAAEAGYTVQNVYAEGRRAVPTKLVLDALEVRRGMPILAVDLSEARERLEAIDWIQSATVERRFPDTIMVRLVERQPLALWQHAGKLTLIDREGAAFGGRDVTRFSHLPLVVGAGAPEAAPRLFDAMAAEPALFKRVVAAIWVGGRRWNIRFDSGLEARLPEGDVAAAWSRLGQLVASRRLLERPVTAVDLRLGDRTVIRMRGEPAANTKKIDQGTT
jgi:cell division protein FtsQ